MKYIFLVLFSTFIVGCGMNKTYHIVSEPNGALVTSGDEVYGTTPFDTDLNTILPNRQWDFKPSATRKLTFTKKGYLPGTAIINEFDTAGTINIRLHKEQGGSSKISRLGELKLIYDKGLITDKEYEMKKNEILLDL